MLFDSNYLELLEVLLNSIHTENQQELYEGILLNIGNTINITKDLREQVFRTQLMEKALAKFNIFKENLSVAEYVIWLISNTINNEFDLRDDLQFFLFTEGVQIFLKHPSEVNFKETVWSLRYLLRRQSSRDDRIQCIRKSGLIHIIINQIQKYLGTLEKKDWIDLALEAIADYYAEVGPIDCSPDFVIVG